MIRELRMAAVLLRTVSPRFGRFPYWIGVMDDVVEFDPALAGLWPVGRAAVYDGRLEDEVRALMLETKSEAPIASPVEEMQGLLNAMTVELREQFALFRTIRARAELAIEGEEAEAKIAKADAKSAVDAISLIIRTLEKIDGLQRGLADALAREAEENFDDAAYQALLAGIDRKITQRAEERANVLLAQRAAAGGGTGPPEGSGVAADLAAGGEEN
jgi:hypothetical protein